MQPVCGCTTMPLVGLYGLAWRSPGCLVFTLENKEDRDTSQISEGAFVVNLKKDQRVRSLILMLRNYQKARPQAAPSRLYIVFEDLGSESSRKESS